MIRQWAELWIERLRLMLGGQPAQVQAAALPWRRHKNRIEVLLVTSRDSGRWILPKGWPRKDEPLHLAAQREAFEEAGIRGRISAVPLGRFRSGRKHSPNREIHVFALEVQKVEEHWPEAGQRERRWLSPKKAAKRISEPSLARLVRSFQGDYPQSV